MHYYNHPIMLRVILRTTTLHDQLCQVISILLIYTNFSKSYIKVLDAKTISNKNVVKCKVIDLVEYYNLGVDLFLSFKII
jgi:hypothetical protein